MAPIVIAVLLAQVQLGPVRQVKPDPKKVEQVCQIRGDECRSAGPGFRPVCIRSGAMKGTVRCDKEKKP